MLESIVSGASRLLSMPGTAASAVLQPMDSIFNIPLVSVLLLPSLSSWSTSFNVLFFYATWSLLLFSHTPLAVEFWGTLLVRLVFFAAPSLLFLALDAALPFLMRNVKRHGDRGIATSAANGGHGPGGRWWRVLALSLFNLVLGVALQTAVDWLLTRVLGWPSALRITRTLPLPWGVIKHLVAGYALREVFSYVGHRWVLHAGDSGVGSGSGASAGRFRRHLRRVRDVVADDDDDDIDEDYEEEDDEDEDEDFSPSSFPSSPSSPPSSPSSSNMLFRYLSRRHKAVFHSLHTPLPLSAHYDDPAAYVVRVWLPTWLPAALLRFHLLTYHLWLALVSVEEALVYSNYSTLPTGLVLGGMARRTERHLLAGARGRGNYGVYGLADLLMGSGIGDGAGDVLDDLAVEARRRDIPRRALRKGRLIRDRAGQLGDGVAPVRQVRAKMDELGNSTRKSARAKKSADGGEAPRKEAVRRRKPKNGRSNS